MQRYQGRQTVKSISKVNQTNREVSVGIVRGNQSGLALPPPTFTLGRDTTG